MKEKFINSGLTFINKYENCDELKTIKLKYGLEGIYNLIIKLSLVLIIAFLTKTMSETILFLIFYAALRTYSFGWHAKSSLGCWVSTIIVYNLIPLLTKNYSFSAPISYAIIIIALIEIILWAPADTPKRPLIHPDKRLKSKLMALLIFGIYLIIFLFNTNKLINNALIYSLLIESILINPLTYKITNTQFNNYKYYHK